MLFIPPFNNLTEIVCDVIPKVTNNKHIMTAPTQKRHRQNPLLRLAPQIPNIDMKNKTPPNTNNETYIIFLYNWALS